MEDLLVRARKKRQRTPPCSQPFQSCDRPNAVWSVDFKGHFSTGDGTRCYPLTTMDAHSRFLLCCEALTDTSVRNAMPVFESVFAEFGLPEAIRSDNGSPFASKGAGGLTELSAWWTRLGIRHERIEPGHPEQNGRHERMHWTLKEQTALPPGASLKAQQRAFDLFRRQYNEERPHQALSNATPSSVYERSPRQLPARLPRFEYPFADGVELVDKQGQIEWGRRKIHINVALYGELVGVWIIDAGRWEVRFGPVLLGYIDRSRPSKKLIVPTPGWNTLAQTP